MHKIRFPLLAVAVLWLASQQLIEQAHAQVQPVEPPAAAQPQMPDAEAMMILIRTSLIALNQANLTGNYTVLRDLGAPGFQQVNDTARLAEIFADLRNRALDLGPVSILDAMLTREPGIDDDGRLRLTGFFPTRPEEVNFDLIFEHAQGRWRLFGIGVGTSQVEPVAAESRPPSEARPEQPANQERVPPAPPPVNASPLVEEAQRLLTRLGYDPGPVDGFVGPRTREAVRAFQRQSGLQETGEITPELIEELRKATS